MRYLRTLLMAMVIALGFGGAAHAQTQTYTFTGVFAQDLGQAFGLYPTPSNLGGALPLSYSAVFDVDTTPNFVSSNYNSYTVSNFSLTLGGLAVPIALDSYASSALVQDFTGSGGSSLFTIIGYGHSEVVGSSPGAEWIQLAFQFESASSLGTGLPISAAAYNPSQTIGLLLAEDNTQSQVLGYIGNYSGLPGFQGGGTFALGSGALPEPATWAMMILGLGAVGAALRRRRPAAGNLAAA